MKKWRIKFWNEHGTRIVYMTAAFGYAAIFIGLANVEWSDKIDKDWIGSAKTILIGLAMLCYNKARGNGATK